jgi:hypothetical protein
MQRFEAISFCMDCNATSQMLMLPPYSTLKMEAQILPNNW